MMQEEQMAEERKRTPLTGVTREDPDPRNDVAGGDLRPGERNRKKVMEDAKSFEPIELVSS